MNSRDRVQMALQKLQPDRVPVVELIIDPGVARRALPEARDVADFCDRMDLDAVSCRANFRTTQLADGNVVDEWGVVYGGSLEEIHKYQVGAPLSSLEDLRSYRPPDPDGPHLLVELGDLVRRYKGSRAIAFRHRAAFTWATMLLGFENMLVAMMTDSTLVDAVMDMVLEVNEAIVRRAVRLGADIVVLGDDYAWNKGPMFSPRVFERFILPRLQRAVDAVHEEGAYCVKHNDGDLRPILPMILDTGIDALHPIDPLGGMDLAELKRDYGDRLCLMGNVDCSYVLPFGSADQVFDAVRRCVEIGAPAVGTRWDRVAASIPR